MGALQEKISKRLKGEVVRQLLEISREGKQWEKAGGFWRGLQTKFIRRVFKRLHKYK